RMLVVASTHYDFNVKLIARCLVYALLATTFTVVSMPAWRSFLGSHTDTAMSYAQQDRIVAVASTGADLGISLWGHSPTDDLDGHLSLTFSLKTIGSSESTGDSSLSSFSVYLIGTGRFAMLAELPCYQFGSDLEGQSVSGRPEIVSLADVPAEVEHMTR